MFTRVTPTQAQKPVLNNRSGFRPSIPGLRRFVLLVSLAAVIWLAVGVYQQLVTESLIVLPGTSETQNIGLRYGSNDPRLYSWVGTYYLLSTQNRDPRKAIEY